jgi:hypothetical protein
MSHLYVETSIDVYLRHKILKWYNRKKNLNQN